MVPSKTRTQTSADSHAHYRVGDLQVDNGTASVLRGDVLVPLPRLSFDLLLVLAREAPNLVSLDALMTQVWPGVVVNHETVSQRIKLLRAALGDDAQAPRYIASVRGRGYRLIARVATCERTTLNDAHPPITVDLRAVNGVGREPRSSNATNAVVQIVAAVVITIGSALFAWEIARDYVKSVSNLPGKAVALKCEHAVSVQ